MQQICGFCGGSFEKRLPRTYCSVPCSNRSPKKKAKVEKTMLERYGVRNNIHRPETQISVRRFNSDPERKARSLEKAKRTMLAETGFTHHFNNPSVQADIQKKSFFLKRQVIAGKKFAVRGYEDRAIRHMVSLGVSVDKIEPFVVSSKNALGYSYKFRGVRRNYTPDFRVSHNGQEFVVEVKSPYTAGLHGTIEGAWGLLKAKARSVVKKGDKFVLLIFDHIRPDPIAWSVGPLTKSTLNWSTA